MDIFKIEVLHVFKTEQAAADTLGIGRTAVTMWKPDKPIPERHALRLRYEVRPDYPWGTMKPVSGEAA